MTVDIKQMRRQARLGAGLRELTNRGFERIHSRELSVAGASKISLRERVEHYAEHAKAAQFTFYPEVRQNLSDQQINGLASQIDSGLMLLEIAKSSEGLVKPMLFYYGLAQVCGAASEAFLAWRGVSPSHGLRVIDYDKGLLRFEGDGSFQKLATTLFVLDGGANPFIEFVFPHRDPTAAVRVSGPTEISFADLLSLRSDPKRLRDWIGNFGIFSTIEDEKRDVGITRLLLNYAVLYYSSCLCRYRPTQWQEILNGRRSLEILQIEGAFEAADKAADGVVNFLRCPSALLLAYSQF
jgi:hypothetical protein